MPREGNARKGALLATVLFALAAATAAVADDTPGVTATEIKIGNTDAYSGPASAYSVIAKLESAFFKMVNDQGGVAGREINFISLDDGYSPPKTLEQVRRLIEQDRVALLFNTTGAACNSAIQKYVNQKRVPHLFLGTGADKFGDYQHYPWTMGFQPSYRTEAQIYAKYILKEKPKAKIAILYQNDDFGKDYPAGMKDILGDNFDKMVVTASYETTDPTIDSQITSLQAATRRCAVGGGEPKIRSPSDP
jgi:branched-chain amino acid transport system substrate-binding protein